MASPATKWHYAANGNFDSSGNYLPGADGFNLADVSSVAAVNSLPAGVEGLVWVGDSINGADASFQASINQYIGNPKVFGFYLADEPAEGHAAQLKAEADYIHKVDPGAITFMILVNNAADTKPQFSYNPANTDIDLFGLDPYPVQTQYNGANYSIIGDAVSAAEAQGIPLAKIVPVYQGFGGGGYASWITPTAAQEQTILSTWGQYVPNPVFDAAYSWGVQSNDTAISTDPALQSVFAAHNAGTSPPPSDTMTASGVAIGGIAGQALNNVTVATFTDSNTALKASGFTAAINWGDGTSSTGTISGSGGSFMVSGTHTYSAAGTDKVAVSLAESSPGTAKATASSTAQIGSAGGALSGKVQLSKATEDTALPGSTKVATFTDTNTADTAAGFTASITWGDGTTSAGTISGSNGSFSVTGGHTYADEGSFPLSVAITRSADKTAITSAGTIAVAEADVLTPHAATITGTAGQALNNVTVATFSNSDTASPASDFTASIAWGDGTTSAGTVSGSGGTFTVSGSHTYAAAGTDAVAVTLTDDAPGTAKATANSTAQIGPGGGGGGGLTISSATTGPLAFSASDSPLTITSSGKVSSTGANVDAVDGPSGARSVVVNAGSLSAAGAGGAGVYLQAGGTVTNTGGAVMSGDYGVYMDAPGVVINAGTIAGRTAAVHFSNTGANRLVVDPTAVFTGAVNGGTAASSLELAGGTGSISGLTGGSGTISQNGSWSFTNFNTLAVDAGGTWTLSGGVPAVTNNGTIGVQGSLDVSSAVDPGSSGLFQLTSGSKLEIAAALGSNTRIAFVNSAELIIDNPLAFGSQVGSASYTGPRLQGFAKGNEIDLRQFGSAGATTLYDASTGLLQISNSAHQQATLEFQPGSLGTGSFHTASDGSGGIFVTLS
jgi:hypothetical protein